MKTLDAFSSSDTDKGILHGYNRYYDEIFKDFSPDSLLEIGIKKGNSLAAWKMLFPNCDLYGLDITNKNFQNDLIEFSDAKITIGNSTKLETANKFSNTYDVIIDDGSHYYKDMMRTFSLFHTKFSRYYVIEDYVYDLNLARQFISSFGYNNISFYKSKRSNIFVPRSAIFRTKSRKSIRIDQTLIVISR